MIAETGRRGENILNWLKEPAPSGRNYASSDGRGCILLPNNGIDSNADYVIYRSDPKDQRPLYYRIEETHGKPFAAISFKPDTDINGGEQLGYLFEKLTGLPRELYPDYNRLGMTPGSKPK